jgi:hypothetical protein
MIAFVVSAVRARRLTIMLAVACLAVPSRRLHAQVTEVPQPFDSAGQVRSITPAVASRLLLTSPVWPVTGEYVEARLFRVSTGGYVIAVQHRGGNVDRYTITEEQRAALRDAVTSVMAVGGRVVGEESPATFSEPARGAFIRNQMLLTALIYGPAAATLTHEGSAGTAVYLLTTGASFFYLANLSKRVNVTRAQNHLATDFALRGTGAVFGAMNALGLDPNVDVGATSTLVGGIGGSFLGYKLGKRLTDSEAHSMTVGSTLTAGIVTGALGTVGLFDVDDEGRAVSASLVASGLAGLPLGLSYPRRAGYTVTAGDADLLPLGALIGAGLAVTPFIDADDPDPKIISGAVTAGALAGTLLADRAFVRKFDHREGEATLIWLGALAGGLMGAAVPIAADSENGTVIVGFAALGSILGAAATVSLLEPRRAGAGTNGGSGSDLRGGGGAERSRGSRGVDVQFAPLNGALAAAGVAGRYPFLTVRF